ncbi:MAG TPA: ATP-binding cassette domain-containing protein [Bryobacteraceae bacterium]|jgi:sodium transport system ATP-binding protein|nr:ATP-binding cassette domain-containing protein [Bryobacteraceae bacterium]
MIEVRNLQKQFTGVIALRNVSFHVPDGAITGLLGANGAGKSTTLRTICGVLTPDAGSVVVDGVSPGDAPLALQSRVGALLDHAGLYARLTPREILTFCGRLHGIPVPRLRERVAEVVDLLDMRSIADRPTGGFSQGERMKTALGRALIHSPRNLLLDEPTSGLDIPAVRALRAFLRRARDGGACILFSSHVLEEVQALCDRIVILAHGEVAAEGTPAEICARAGAASLEDAFVALTSAEVSAC